MAVVWLDITQYPSIRAAIEVGLTISTLPDSVIALPIYAGAAEFAVKGLDPDWASHTAAAEDELLTIAAIYWCASLLLPSIPNVVKESIGKGDHSYQLEGLSIKDRIAFLRGVALAAIVALSGDPSDVMPEFFRVAPGLRMRYATRTTLPEGSLILGLP